MTGAYGGVALAIIGIWVEYGLWYITVAFIVGSALMMIFNIKNKIWWVEVLAFISVLTAMCII